MKNFLTGLFLLLTFAAHGEEVKQVPVVTIQTNLGPIEVELNPAKSPESVENFLTYAKEGFYEGTVFHRVIESFVVQGGGYTTDFKKKNTHDPIPNEAANGLKNVRGTVAMARTSEPHSASSQFFFNVKDNKFLDYKSQTPSGFGYCVFGKVVEGMDVVDKIAKLPTDSDGPFRRDVPQTPVVIEAVRIGYAPPTKWVMAAPEKSPPPEKKKGKPEMPSMVEMQQDMLSDIDSMGEEESEGTKKGTKGGAATAKTDSAAADTAKAAEADKADKAKADATESETSDQSQGAAPKEEPKSAEHSAKSTESEPSEKPKSAEHSAKGTESKPSVATQKVANDSQDSKDSTKDKDSEESDNVTSEESKSEEEAIAPGSSATDSEETKADEKTKADKSPPASATPSASPKANPKEPKSVAEKNAKGEDEGKSEGEGRGEEDENGNSEPENPAEKSNVTRSAMAVSNEMKRLAAEEEDKPMEKTNQVIPKPAVKTPPPGAKPPDSPTSPDKPEPPAN